jgi:hypothetical protein
MKLLFALIIPVLVHAESWFAAEKVGARTSYADKSACESSESAACYDISSCPLDVCSIAQVAVPDPNQPPVLTMANETGCGSPEDCAALLPSLCSVGNPVWGDRLGTGTLTAWCVISTQPTMQKKVLQQDSAKKAAADADAADNVTKNTKLVTLRAAIKTCVKNWASLNAAQKDACLAGAIKVLGAADLKGSEL